MRLPSLPAQRGRERRAGLLPAARGPALRTTEGGGNNLADVPMLVESSWQSEQRSLMTQCGSD